MITLFISVCYHDVEIEMNLIISAGIIGRQWERQTERSELTQFARIDRILKGSLLNPMTMCCHGDQTVQRMLYILVISAVQTEERRIFCCAVPLQLSVMLHQSASILPAGTANVKANVKANKQRAPAWIAREETSQMYYSV